VTALMAVFYRGDIKLQKQSPEPVVVQTTIPVPGIAVAKTAPHVDALAIETTRT